MIRFMQFTINYSFKMDITIIHRVDVGTLGNSLDEGYNTALSMDILYTDVVDEP